MSDIKRPPAQGSLRAHAARDFHRGFQTKNMVKGAAGGARGVDFQDTEGEYLDRLNKGGAEKGGAGKAESAEAREHAARAEQASQQMERNASEVVLTDIVQNPREKVNAPITHEEERKKKKTHSQQPSEEDAKDPAAKAEEHNELLVVPDSEGHHEHILSSISKVLQDPTAEHKVLGAFALTDPQQMRKSLGTPIRVAKHLLVLAGRMIAEQQKPRVEVLEYLAKTFLSLGPEFGARAFKDFSGSIGIGSLYPLEVREKMIEIDEKFLPTMKCRFTTSKRMLTGKVKEMLTLEYDEELVITGFAVKGGGKQGYQLAPLKEKGKHGLRFFEAGDYKVLLMGVDPMGFERMEEIKVTITADATAQKPLVATGNVPAVPRRNLRYNFSKK